MVKAFADAWFLTIETSNTSMSIKNLATVDAHVSVLYPYHTFVMREGMWKYIHTRRGVFVARFDGRVSSKTSIVERVTAWVPRFSCTYFFGVVQLFE